MDQEYRCPRCGNTNPKYIGYKNGEPYCRFCISMRGVDAEKYVPKGGPTVVNLNYHLSKEQEEIANHVLDNFRNGIDSLINAVCGAGKTELVYKVIAYAISTRKTVGFAIPRRDVVIELMPRIQQAFPKNSVVCVYGGHNEKLTGDIVVLTTHQLFRYEKFFDLLIVDEIDAFPYNGSLLLETMLKRSLRGHSVMMSATPSKEVIEYYSKDKREILELNTRFHHKPLSVPVLKIRPGMTKIPFLISLLKKYESQNKPVFVFTPTIEICEEVFKIVSKITKNGNCVHSKKVDRNEIIDNFKKRKTNYLITTAVLERGVTIKNIQVVIYQADHELYDEHSLIQISGRVGRKFDAPEGDVIFLANKETKSIKTAIETIKRKNESL